MELVSGVSEILIAANIRESAAGAEAKFWLEEPVTEEHWLLKSVTVKDGHVHGEDCAEKAASHLGNLLASPCAAPSWPSGGPPSRLLASSDTWLLDSEVMPKVSASLSTRRVETPSPPAAFQQPLREVAAPDCQTPRPYSRTVTVTVLSVRNRQFCR